MAPESPSDKLGIRVTWMKLPLKCKQDCSPGQEGGPTHPGWESVGCIALGTAMGEYMGDKSPSFARSGELAQGSGPERQRHD